MATDFECLNCDNPTSVERTIKSGSVIRRVRKCIGDPSHTFETSESYSDLTLFVSRSDGTVEPFVRAKVEAGVRRAGAGVLARGEEVRLVDEVMGALALAPNKVIPTRDIGQAVQRVLLRKRPIAGLRFATVFATSRRDVPVTDPASFQRYLALAYVGAWKPQPAPPEPVYVMKRPRAQKMLPWGEPFDLVKYYESIEVAARRLTPGDDPELFVGSLVAEALSDVAGQAVVHSGQLSAAALRVLRAEVPLGYLRYAATAKQFVTTAAFADELQGLIDVESTSMSRISEFRESGAQILDRVRAKRAASSAERDTPPATGPGPTSP